MPCSWRLGIAAAPAVTAELADEGGLGFCTEASAAGIRSETVKLDERKHCGDSADERVGLFRRASRSGTLL